MKKQIPYCCDAEGNEIPYDPLWDKKNVRRKPLKNCKVEIRCTPYNREEIDYLRNKTGITNISKLILGLIAEKVNHYKEIDQEAHDEELRNALFGITKN